MNKIKLGIHEWVSYLQQQEADRIPLKYILTEDEINDCDVILHYIEREEGRKGMAFIDRPLPVTYNGMILRNVFLKQSAIRELKGNKRYEMNVEIEYYGNGQKRFEYYTQDRLYHRDDEPAVQYWYENGTKQSELYYLEGVLHRIDGPAVQNWTLSGNKIREQYYINGRLHRIDGPAWYDRYSTDVVEYYINGREYTKEEFDLVSQENREKVVDIAEMF